MEVEAKKNASLFDALIVKSQTLSVNGVLIPFYLAFAVDGGKKSTPVVGKYGFHVTMRKGTAHGGVGGNGIDLCNLLRKGGGKWCDMRFGLVKLLTKSTMLQA